MNPQRYIMPVIIAAGLHGALVFFSSDKNPPSPPPEKYVAPPLPPVPRIEMIDPSLEPNDGGVGKADPLPSQQDIERPVTAEDIFTIRVTPPAESIRPVTALPPDPTGLIGSEEIGKRIGRPSLPTAINLDRVPRATVRPAPHYPGTMRSTNGSVTVEFVVDTTGRVVTADAVRWTHRDFVDPTVQAVLRWRFEPGTINGRKVSFRMAIPIEFVATD